MTFETSLLSRWVKPKPRSTSLKKISFKDVSKSGVSNIVFKNGCVTLYPKSLNCRRLGHQTHPKRMFEFFRKIIEHRYFKKEYHLMKHF